MKNILMNSNYINFYSREQYLQGLNAPSLPLYLCDDGRGCRSGGAELVGLAGLRQGAERRPAQVEVHGLHQARAGGAQVGEHHRHRAAGARRVAGAFHLRRIYDPNGGGNVMSYYSFKRSIY